MMIKRLIFYILPILVLSCATGGFEKPPRLSFSDLPAYIDSAAPRYVSRTMPGIQIALIEGGKTIYENGFGYSSYETKEPVTDGTLFQVASISKTVTAWGILKLAEDNVIDIDAPIANYVKTWSLGDSSYDSGRISVRSILAHRAGLTIRGYPGYAPGTTMPDIRRSLDGDNGLFYGVYGMEPLRLIDEPWAKFSYSGGGFTLLQLMVEELSGKRFSEYMDEAVLVPAGMRNSTFDYRSVDTRKLSSCYSAFGAKLPNYLFTERAAAGLYSNAGDLASLLNDLFRIKSDETYRSPVLSREYARLFYELNPMVVDGPDYVGYAREKSGGQIIAVYHGGENRGWRSFYGMELETGRGIVILTNSDSGVKAIDGLLESFRIALRDI